MSAPASAVELEQHAGPPVAPSPAVEVGGPAAADSGGGEAYYDADFSWIRNGPLRKTARTLYPAAYRCYIVMDFIGEKVANALGLTSSRFQYAVDEYHRRERRKQRKAELKRQRELEAIRQRGLRGLGGGVGIAAGGKTGKTGSIGGNDDDDDDDAAGSLGAAEDDEEDDDALPYVPPVVTERIPAVRNTAGAALPAVTTKVAAATPSAKAGTASAEHEA